MLGLLMSFTAHAQMALPDKVMTGNNFHQASPQNQQVNQQQLQQQAGAPMPAMNETLPLVNHSRMFGAQLFNGMFRNAIGSGFNSGYMVNPGDQIVLRMWGAYVFDGQLVVDPQGNIFIPNVGPVKVSGVSNGQLNGMIKSAISRVYRANVEVYAALGQAQPVKVFVTGFVSQPGLYGGISSDSVLSYLDKAGGVDPERGSYVDILVKRNNQVVGRVNLYEFLLSGSLNSVQLRDGDVVMVQPRKHTFSVSGDVYNSYDFEFEQSNLSLSRALQVARPKPGATHVSIIRRQGTEKRSEYYPINEAYNVVLQDGDSLVVTADRYAGTIQVRIEGAHSGEHALVLPYGSTMQEVLNRINVNSMSKVDSIQLYRKSVAVRQKEMLDVSLQKLEQASLTSSSVTREEAELRAQEAQIIAKFVEKARLIEPKGQVVLTAKNMNTTLLEDGDVIHIPEKSSLVTIHGEVMFPNAVSWDQSYDVDDYIEKVGGYAQSKKKSRVIVIHQNGESANAKNNTKIAAGDEIMVLPEVKTKSVEVTRGISQILYQIAVAAKVVFGL